VRLYFYRASGSTLAIGSGPRGEMGTLDAHEEAMSPPRVEVRKYARFLGYDERLHVAAVDVTHDPFAKTSNSRRNAFLPKCE